ncbi:nitric oxide synthase oxygenase [Planococcus lenghuensis]|uniref:Nitric oxide synthase oxygenase n=1 Tax=Planococcus lenghuensis TaxID=2213202 RepID=A0A1Q2KUN8_9BACL|nr:nitric oxide synthase oxygenase [Planococcus lenghuensis]AQQ51834.1 nitric oxide synthase [Planococcus lenghuensis]
MDTNLWQHAQTFIELYYHENDLPADRMTVRLDTVKEEIQRTGTYRHTAEELTYGARVAWRNSNRCIGRLFWQTLQVSDEREAQSAEDVFAALERHVVSAYNNGKIRPLITVFRPSGIRIRNHQLLRYAGYETAGDAHSKSFTAYCQRLGWKGAGTDFDLLPWVVQIGDQPPAWQEVPEHARPEVTIEHPEYAEFNDLNLKWYAVPVISDMKLEIGGIAYEAAPFNGWYMGTEIGARNLADEDRYNLLPAVAQYMGLDTRRLSSLWKDRALIELNAAVLYSFKKAGVTIVDHHTAAKQFQTFEQNEAAAHRDVTGNWVWLIPPVSPAATSIFHKRYDNAIKTPNFFHQPSSGDHREK